MSDAKVTSDHGAIQKWVEARGGHPARVKGTGGKGSGVLRIDYPGYSGEETLKAIEWDEFFEGFEENNLAFLHQDKTKEGELSRFSKFVERGSEQGAAKGKGA
ncbi:MAG TPA: lipocalin/fatty-acid binding family protein [Pyrinomonadaceae bacterium]|nr:lipocalin/fatty-acid binding family protein [Pyrinomonadaceae bacterium]